MKTSSSSFFRIKPLLGTTAAAVAAFSIGVSLPGTAAINDPTSVGSAAMIDTDKSVTATAGSLGLAAPDFAKIAAQQGKAVVNITVRRHASEREATDDQMSNSEQVPEFFRRFLPPEAFGRGPDSRGPNRGPSGGEGSGFILSANGLILTNAHVVDKADEVIVKLTDRREYTAKVLGADRRTDVAVLKIEATDLPIVKLGSPQKLQVGEWVLAIGSPFGFDNTATVGVVSAKGRSLPSDSLVPFIQTDVAVNPGNSGGPLFNTRGEVIGINSQIFSRSGGYQGLSFAIPIDLAINIKNQIEQTGEARHARLGVMIQEVNQTLASAFDLPRPAGALVSQVMKGGPAEKAGIRIGDVIQAVDEREILSSAELPSIVGMSAPGSAMAITVWRDGEPRILKATLGDSSKKPAQQAKPKAADPEPASLGLTLRPFQADELDRAGQSQGFAVAKVNGQARAAGVRPGDLILSINSTPVESIDQIRSAVAAGDGAVALLVMRGTDRIYVPVKTG